MYVSCEPVMKTKQKTDFAYVRAKGSCKQKLSKCQMFPYASSSHPFFHWKLFWISTTFRLTSFVLLILVGYSHYGQCHSFACHRFTIFSVCVCDCARASVYMYVFSCLCVCMDKWSLILSNTRKSFLIFLSHSRMVLLFPLSARQHNAYTTWLKLNREFSPLWRTKICALISVLIELCSGSEANTEYFDSITQFIRDNQTTREKKQTTFFLLTFVQIRFRQFLRQSNGNEFIEHSIFSVIFFFSNKKEWEEK